MQDGSVETRFDTRAEYHHAIDAVLRAATREICIFDPDLKNIDLDGLARSESVAAFLSGGRERTMRIVLHDTEHLSRHCARLNGLLRRFSHCVHVRQTPDSLRSLPDCFMLADDANAVIRFHADLFRGKLLVGSPDEVQGWHQRFEDLWLESTPAVPATHLGL